MALQWVHGLLTVGDGKNSETVLTIVGLQWVHGLLTVGDVAVRWCSPTVRLLQWVHGLLTVGDETSNATRRRSLSASMGPRPSDRGRHGDCRRGQPAVQSFNGSTAF